MRNWVMVLLLAGIALSGCTDDGDDGDGDRAGSGTADASICTNFGGMEVDLFDDLVPVTAKNFRDLAERGYYDGVTFHRIITGFMMQGGDPTGTGSGGEAADGGTIEDEFHPDLRHDRAGLLSMANSGPDSGSSQFFITFAPTPWLDDKHAIFGEVTSGMDVVQEIEEAAGSSGGTPRTDVSMHKVLVGEGQESCPDRDAPTEPEQKVDACMAPDTPVVLPDAIAESGQGIDLGLITPGHWHVTGAPDHLMVWARNHDDAEAGGTWALTAADEGALPDGWNVSFDPPDLRLAAAGTVESGRPPTYADWGSSVATLRLPDGAEGEWNVTFHLGAATVDAVVSAFGCTETVAVEGTNVDVATVGTLLRDGSEFWSGDFQTGAGMPGAVKGYADGLLGLADGETAGLVVPPPFAYGYPEESGHELAGETLVFQVTPTFL